MQGVYDNIDMDEGYWILYSLGGEVSRELAGGVLCIHVF